MNEEIEYKNKLSDLIEALNIFLKYEDKSWPTHCEHDEMTIDFDPEIISEDDKQKLDELGFFVDESENDFKSFRFGSC